jgi:hypothetical protein
MDIKKQLEKLLTDQKAEKGETLLEGQALQRARQSKHMGKYFKATKAYADDRQKRPWNRRKNGRRRRH